MKKVMFLFICWALPLQAQEFNPKTIALTENPTNAELQFLKEELKGKQVVLLGESTHFDGNVFDYRNKIIEYLVTKLGFTTIAFESGVYDLYKVNSEVKEGENIQYALQNGLMIHWSKAKEFHWLFNFIESKKLKLYGFDSQLQSLYAKRFFIADFKAFLSENKIQVQVDSQFIEELKSVVFNYKFDVDLYKYVDFQSKMDMILSEIVQKPKNDELIIWKRIIKGISKVAEDVFRFPEEPKTTFFLGETDKIRDKQMAENLLTYIKDNPNEKIICLGANAHFINDLSKLNQPKLKEIQPMGSYLKENLASKMYTLALITSCVNRLESNSIEEYVNKKTDNHLFFSTHQKDFEQPILNCFVGDGKFIKSKIVDFFDGCITFKTCEGYEQGKIFKSSKKVTYQIKGKLINKKTKKPIVFATVSLPNSSIMGFSDKNGNYTLTVPKKLKISKLKIDYMGFEHIYTYFKPVLKLNLTEKVNVLEEVEVKAKKLGKTIIKEAISKKWKNHLRKKTVLNKKCRAIYKEKDSVYLDFSFKTTDLNRPNFKYRGKTEGITLCYNKGFVEKDSITNLPFYRTAFYFPVLEKNNIDDYKFNYEKDTVFNNEKAYKITFLASEKEHSHTRNNIPTDCSGVIYISMNTSAFLKIVHQHKWEKEKFGTEKLNMYWYVPMSKRKNRNITKWQTTFNFKKDNDSNLYLYDTIITEWRGYYISVDSEKTKLYTQQKSEFTKSKT